METRLLILDVGHVIVPGSILNHVLQRLGSDRVAEVLYDMSVLEDANADELDAWVAHVIERKLAALFGLPVKRLQGCACELPLTPGLDDCVHWAATNDIEVRLIGAVPTMFTRALLRHNGIRVAAVAGTVVHTNAGCLTGVREICTPSRKAQIVSEWISAADLKPAQVTVVGDSIGDLPMMRLVPLRNRIGFNATHSQVKQCVGQTLSHSMVNIAKVVTK